VVVVVVVCKIIIINQKGQIREKELQTRKKKMESFKREKREKFLHIHTYTNIYTQVNNCIGQYYTTTTFYRIYCTSLFYSIFFVHFCPCFVASIYNNFIIKYSNCIDTFVSMYIVVIVFFLI